VEGLGLVLWCVRVVVVEDRRIGLVLGRRRGGRRRRRGRGRGVGVRMRVNMSGGSRLRKCDVFHTPEPNQQLHGSESIKDFVFELVHVLKDDFFG
jgi:hypothetical protein